MTTQQLQQLADKHRGEHISLFEAVQREQNEQSNQPAKTVNTSTGRETRYDNDNNDEDEEDEEEFYNPYLMTGSELERTTLARIQGFSPQWR